MDAVNEYVDRHKPWEMAKRPDDEALLHRVLSTTMRCFARLSILIKPICPLTVAQIEEEIFKSASLTWSDLDYPPISRLDAFRHLMSRIDRDAIDRLILANR